MIATNVWILFCTEIRQRSETLNTERTAKIGQKDKEDNGYICMVPLTKIVILTDCTYYRMKGEYLLCRTEVNSLDWYKKINCVEPLLEGSRGVRLMENERNFHKVECKRKMLGDREKKWISKKQFSKEWISKK